jgi:hypothetical protein
MMWSRVLVVLCFFSLSAQANPPEEPGTRVSIKLAESTGQLPEAEKLVKSIETVGGEHLVRVQRHHDAGQQELTMDMWGGTVPQADIPQTLRDAFPVLAAADIQVSTLDPKDRPKMNPGELRKLRGEKDGEPGTVKRVVKIIKKE